jgi:hypothetical protein
VVAFLFMVAAQGSGEQSASHHQRPGYSRNQGKVEESVLDTSEFLQIFKTMSDFVPPRYVSASRADHLKT